MSEYNWIFDGNPRYVCGWLPRISVKQLNTVAMCPQYALGVYDQLVAVGADFGLRNAGRFALDSLRVENGYCFWGQDLDVETNPWEAQLGYTVNMAKV